MGQAVSAASSANPLGKPCTGEWGSSRPAIQGGIGGRVVLQLPGCSARSAGGGAGGEGAGLEVEGQGNPAPLRSGDTKLDLTSFEKVEVRWLRWATGREKELREEQPRRWERS